MKNTMNPIALQSQHWIVSALLDLMKTQDYSKISIKDIAAHSNLDRRTFYRNFQSKEEVLSFYIKMMCDEFIAAQQVEKNDSTFQIAKTYFELCLKHLHFLNLMNMHRLFGFLLAKYNEYMPSLQMQDISPDLKAYYGNHLSFLYAFNNGGFWNLSILWIKNGAIQTPEEMAAIVCKIVYGMSECNF